MHSFLLCAVGVVGVLFYRSRSVRHTKEPICCFHLARGCRGNPCRYLHAPDDGVSPCSYGATCKLGHAGRALSHLSLQEQQAYWQAFRGGGTYEGASPSARDATRLRSQLEPWPTAVLRSRLVEDFGASREAVDALGRGEVMQQLLAAYAAAASTRPRRVVRVQGRPVRPALQAQLLLELQRWAAGHTVNTRPSVSASSYMILRSPAEFGLKDSKNARVAAAKIEQYQALWDLASLAIAEADGAFARTFTALAVTHNFSGSPHIDKQNTGPFYGLALGDFAQGQGALCVECSAFEVASVDTKGRLGKVDGRYPHWVAPYDSGSNRYSLIYYQTEGVHSPPGAPHFGRPVESEGSAEQ